MGGSVAPREGPGGGSTSTKPVPGSKAGIVHLLKMLSQDLSDITSRSPKSTPLSVFQ